jgi:signal transduction histidine kinase
MRERRSLHVHDLQTEHPDTSGARAGIRTILFAPLLRQGSAVGLLQLSVREVRPFTPAQIKLVETFADQAVIAVENSRLFRELQDRTAELGHSVEQLEALGAVTQAVTSTLDLGEVLQRIVGHARRLAGAEGGTVYEYVDEGHAFHWRAADGVDERLTALQREASPFPAGPGSALGMVALTRAPVQGDLLPPDDPSAPEWQSNVFRRVGFEVGVRALLGVPLLREDRLLGVLNLYRSTPGEFAPETVALVERFAAQSALAIQNARLFREIEAKSRELEVASRHKSEFLAAMSHELRTPLNAVIGFSEVLLEQMFGDVNEKQEDYLQDILASGRHLLSLINDILDLSKVEAGRMELEPGRFSLAEAVENSLTMLRERASRHGIDLNLEIDPAVKALPEIEADERKVKQVLFNLLTNAVKFTPDGGSVRVAALLKEGEIAVSVTDTGIGIAPEDQERIFEAFQQAGHSAGRAKEGTGLGLPLARQFVELHGGRMWVESQVGKGSTFSFSLPLAQVVAGGGCR